MTDRKARLAALAAKAGRTKEPATEESNESESNDPKVNFRNYVPQDVSLRQEAPQERPDQQPVSKKPKLEEALEKAQQEVQQASSTSTLATTKKINWDLKRDVEPQLEKLERQTQKALVALLKERLIKEAEEDETLD